MTVSYQNWLDVLDEVGAAGLVQLDVADLSAIQTLLADDEAKLKARKAKLHQVFMQRFSNHVTTPGTKKTVDGVRIEVPKNVKWDQEELDNVRARIAREWECDTSEYIETKLHVPENKWNSWPQAIKDVFAPARTVNVGTPKFSFTESV